MIKRNYLIGIAAVFIIFVAVAVPVYFLRPVSGSTTLTGLDVVDGESFRAIAANLESLGLIRSKAVFGAYLILTGQARHLKPGHYELAPNMGARGIAHELVGGPVREATVVIPEGSTIYNIDAALAAAKVLPVHAFEKIAEKESLEGYLFPDTYKFYFNSTPEDVVKKMRENFKTKAEPILAQDPVHEKQNLILASIIEREVPDTKDRQLVAGILVKRVKAELALQADATLCYIKERLNKGGDCYPVTSLDRQLPSPYNTYLHKGWPPGPIANPGIDALRAALSPLVSPYWYYLSDPVTKQTIFSKTFDEHLRNQSKY
jgi:UPF0755 protein